MPCISVKFYSNPMDNDLREPKSVLNFIKLKEISQSHDEYPCSHDEYPCSKFVQFYKNRIAKQPPQKMLCAQLVDCARGFLQF